MARTIATKRFSADPIDIDTFTRTDSTTTLSATEGLRRSWGVLGSGVYGITSNQAYPVSGAAGNPAYLDVGSPDVIVVVSVATYDGSANEEGIYFRLTDTNNWWRFIRSTTNLLLQKRAAGATTTVASRTRGFTNGDIYKVRAYGNQILCYLNDALVISTEDEANNTATKHGFGQATGNANARFDNFKIYY